MADDHSREVEGTAATQMAHGLLSNNVPCVLLRQANYHHICL
jgi:hypothetical protein